MNFRTLQEHRVLIDEERPASDAPQVHQLTYHESGTQVTCLVNIQIGFSRLFPTFRLFHRISLVDFPTLWSKSSGDRQIRGKIRAVALPPVQPVGDVPQLLCPEWQCVSRLAQSRMPLQDGLWKGGNSILTFWLVSPCLANIIPKPQPTPPRNTPRSFLQAYISWMDSAHNRYQNMTTIEICTENSPERFVHEGIGKC